MESLLGKLFLFGFNIIVWTKIIFTFVLLFGIAYCVHKLNKLFLSKTA